MAATMRKVAVEYVSVTFEGKQKTDTFAQNTIGIPELKEELEVKKETTLKFGRRLSGHHACR